MRGGGPGILEGRNSTTSILGSRLTLPISEFRTVLNLEDCVKAVKSRGSQSLPKLCVLCLKASARVAPLL